MKLKKDTKFALAVNGEIIFQTDQDVLEFSLRSSHGEEARVKLDRVSSNPEVFDILTKSKSKGGNPREEDEAVVGSLTRQEIKKRRTGSKIETLGPDDNTVVTSATSAVNAQQKSQAKAEADRRRSEERAALLKEEQEARRARETKKAATKKA